MQKLAQLCIRRPVFATMLILALVVIGLDSYRKLGVDYFPKVEFPFVNVQTVLPGASERVHRVTRVCAGQKLQSPEAVRPSLPSDALRSLPGLKSPTART